MNKILERQLKKAFGSLEQVPLGFEALIKAVSDTYDHAEEDRLLMERSLDISSRELSEVNARQREESDKLKKNFAELERVNRLMVDRELKMVELKKEIDALQAARGSS